MSTKDVAGWKSKPTFAQLKELLAQCEQGQLSKAHMQAILRQENPWPGELFELFYSVTESQISAQNIMDFNYFGLHEAVQYFGWIPSPENLAMFAEVPFSKEVLEECKDTHILVAYPGFSIMESVRSLKGVVFAEELSLFRNLEVATKRGRAGWRLVRKAPFGDGCFREDSLPEGERAPSARLLIYLMACHQLERNTSPFVSFGSKWWTRDYDNQVHYAVGIQDSGVSLFDIRHSRRSGNMDIMMLSERVPQ